MTKFKFLLKKNTLSFNINLYNFLDKKIWNYKNVFL